MLFCGFLREMEKRVVRVWVRVLEVEPRLGRESRLLHVVAESSRRQLHIMQEITVDLELQIAPRLLVAVVGLILDIKEHLYSLSYEKYMKQQCLYCHHSPRLFREPEKGIRGSTATRRENFLSLLGIRALGPTFSSPWELGSQIGYSLF
ncbi:hypothetical protein ACMD2_00900 [Ananas comosus]|uniref:Uncharacterized protein n=1 Tax=Ananas comosus TaxID=4615 RepID=A0A199UM36_ANACO|nr:hypothetical protein ACMD2_00900 [Ananas comosus]